MKKFLLWMVVLALIVIMVGVFSFTGCQPPAVPATTTEAGETTATTAAEKEPVNLKFVGWEVSPLETESVKKGLEIFMSKNPNITVDYNPIPHDQYTSKVLTMMMAGTCPDVFFCFAFDYRSFIKGGRLLDLTNRFNESYDITDYIHS